MGYYTSYYMEVKGCKDEQCFSKLTKEMKKYDLFGYVFDEPSYDEGPVQYFSTFDMQKWYEHEEELTAISKLFPELTFRLSGNGEGYDDCWEKYFKNGESEYCEMTIPPPKHIKW